MVRWLHCIGPVTFIECFFFFFPQRTDLCNIEFGRFAFRSWEFGHGLKEHWNQRYTFWGTWWSWSPNSFYIEVNDLSQCEGFFFFFQFLKFNLIFILYWSIVDLQCWVHFRCTAKWFSYIYIYILFHKDKESTCNVGDRSLIPGLGRSPGGGHGNPFQYSCLENLMDRGAWWATDHGVEKSWTQLSG